MRYVGPNYIGVAELPLNSHLTNLGGVRDREVEHIRRLPVDGDRSRSWEYVPTVCDRRHDGLGLGILILNAGLLIGSPRGRLSQSARSQMAVKDGRGRGGGVDGSEVNKRDL
jgi:hypothetical protein